MKKLTLFVVALLFLSLYSPVFAKNDKDNGNSNSKQISSVEQEDDEHEEEMEDEDEDEDDYSSKSSAEAAKERNTVRKLNRIMDETEDEEIEEEADELAQEQEEIEERVEETIEEVDKRPSFVKFLIGPDYKNLGQLRKEVVQTTNNVRQLEHLKEKAGEEDQGSIDEAILELQTRAGEIQADIGERLSGFSLFGWLTRWLSDYDETDPPEEPTVTPIPTVDPSVTPGEEPEPTVVIPEPSITPVVTIVPTVTPEVTP